jgi:hypothetical protein
MFQKIRENERFYVKQGDIIDINPLLVAKRMIGFAINASFVGEMSEEFSSSIVKVMALRRSPDNSLLITRKSKLNGQCKQKRKFHLKKYIGKTPLKVIGIVSYRTEGESGKRECLIAI